MKDTKAVHFRVNYTIRDLHLSQKDGPMQFAFDLPEKLKVTVDAHEGKNGADWTNASCLVEVTRTPPVEVVQILEDLKAGKISKPAGKGAGFSGYIDASGKIIGNVLPSVDDFADKEFKSWNSKLSQELRNHVIRLVGIIRWRKNQMGPHSPLSFRSFDWSFDGQTWSPMPHSMSVSLFGNQILNWNSDTKKDISGLFQGNSVEPLAYELLREAWEQKGENPRSALILGMAAAEVGIKSYIADVSPVSKWLVEELPAPPTHRLYDEYFPNLPAKAKLNGSNIKIPKDNIDAIREGGRRRNKVVHTSSQRVTVEEVNDLLVVVNEVLLMLDLSRGYTWALENLGAVYRKEFEGVTFTNDWR